MVFFLEIIFLMVLIGITYQDLKDQKVTLLLFILANLLGGYIHYTNTYTSIFFRNLSINIVAVFFIGAFLFLYAKFKLNKKLFTTIGLGDFFFFFILAISFPTITFLLLFSTSLIFSLILFLLLKPNLKHNTVPLAGLQALFLSLILILNWGFKIVNLYIC